MKSSAKSAVRALLIATCLFSLVFMAGCGHKDLESYLNKHLDERDAIASVIDESGGTVKIKDNEMVVTYSYDFNLTDDEKEKMAPELEEDVKDRTPDALELIDELQSRTGIRPIVVKIVYLDQSGAEIYSTEISDAK